MTDHDPLSAPRGILNAILLELTILALVLAAFWLWVS